MLSELEKRLLNEYQRGFPFTAAPFAVIAGQLGTSEDVVISTLRRLEERGYISRVGAVARPNTIAASALIALAVPPKRLDAVATLVSSFPQVNHNYEREHQFNLWFVAADRDEPALLAFLHEIEERTGLTALYLPLVEDFHIDLGFPIAWN
jgi:DNA-binding Lrp family transcriptional regulator